MVVVESLENRKSDIENLVVEIEGSQEDIGMRL